MIESGDLVYVAHTCCTERVSHWVFVVESVESSAAFGDKSRTGLCAGCYRPVPGGLFAGPAGGVYQPIVWLRKIDPTDVEIKEVVADEVAR